MEEIAKFTKMEFEFLKDLGFSTPQFRSEWYGCFLTFHGKLIDLVVEMDSRDDFYGVAAYPKGASDDLKKRVYFRTAIPAAARLGLCELPNDEPASKQSKRKRLSPEAILKQEADWIRTYFSVISNNFSKILIESRNWEALKAKKN